MKKLEEKFEFNNKEYISIYKVAEMIGRDAKGLIKQSSRERFIVYLNNLPQGVIEMVNLDKLIITDVAFPKVKALYSNSSIQQFLNDYTRKSDILRLVDGNYIGSQIANDSSIPEFKLGIKNELRFYQNSLIEKYCHTTEYISIYSVAEMIGRDVKELRKQSHRERLTVYLNNLPQGIIEMITLNKYITTDVGFPKVKTLYSRISVQQFLKNYTRKSDILKVLEGNNIAIKELANDSSIPEFQLGIKNELKFYQNDLIKKYYHPSEYISIYELAEMIGRDAKGLIRKRSREKFIVYLNNLPQGLIEMVTLDKSIISDVGFPPVNTIYSRSSVVKFLKDHTRKSDVLKLMNGNFIGIQELERDISIPKFELGMKNEFKFYQNNLIKKYYHPTDFQRYMNIYEIGSCKFGKKPNNDRFFKKLKEQIAKLPNGMIKKIKLDLGYTDIRVNRFITEVFSRDDVERFFSTYILKSEAYKDIENYGTIYASRKYYKKLKIHEIVLGGNTDIFILKCDYEKLKELCIAVAVSSNISTIKVYAKAFNYITKEEAMDILNLSYYAFIKLNQEKIIIADDKYNGQELFSESYIKEVYGEQVKLLQKYKCKYYTASEISEKFSLPFAKYVQGFGEKMRRPVDKVEIPMILAGYLGTSSKKCYDKSQIESLWLDYNLYTNMNSLSVEQPFENFIYKVDHVLKIEFCSEQEKTKELWYQYTCNVFRNTKLADKARITFMVNQFARNTEKIFSVFKKEIYTYRADEVNRLYLNSGSSVARSHQREFYNFLKQLILSFRADGFPVPFSTDELNNPIEYEIIKDLDTSIYSLEEYHALYKHVNLVEYHKQKAINSVRIFLRTMNITKYNHYDSCWLYILIQLTNNWRHSTILTQMPRIDLSHTQIKNMEWLVDNNPSLEDANNIIFQIGRYVTNINKTGVSAEGIFNIGEPLKIAFATAISICEFRARGSIKGSSDLIYLSGNLVSKNNPHKIFFKDFISGFKFENRKINRTLSTLIWSVLRHLGKGLKETQVSRSHMREETTINHYIKLTDKQVEHLVLEMFERNQFGYITQMLTNILFGTETDKSIETSRIVAVNNNFGDVIKIEATAGVINRLAIDKQEVIKYLQSFSLEEIHTKYNQMIIGILPSKKNTFNVFIVSVSYKMTILSLLVMVVQHQL